MIPPRTKESGHPLRSGPTEQGAGSEKAPEPIQEAFRALSRARNPSAPLDAREAIFKVAAEQTRSRTDSSSGRGRTFSAMWEQAKRSFLGPWPYAAVTAMLAIVAVTVAVRVQPEAGQVVGAETAVQKNAKSAEATTGRSTKAEEAPDLKDASSVLTEEPTETKELKQESLKKELTAGAKLPPKAMRTPDTRISVGKPATSSASPATESSAQSQSQSQSRPEAFAKQAPSGVSSVPGGLSDKTPTESEQRPMRSEAESMAQRTRRSPEESGPAPTDWIVELIPFQARAKTLTILADHGALAVTSADGAVQGPRPQALGPSEFEQVFQLREGGRLSCRFRSEEGGKEDVLVRCRKLL